jgi:hypothetical protein
VKFDFTFGEMMQVVVALISMFLAIFIFASSQDDGFEEDGELLTSYSGRSALKWTFKFALFSFMVTLALSENVVFSKLTCSVDMPPSLKSATEYWRGMMRGRSSAELAPFIRGALIVMTAVSLIPTFSAFTLVLETSHSVDAEKASWLTFFGLILNYGFASILCYARPTSRGKHRFEDAFFLVTTFLNIGLAVVTHVLHDRATISVTNSVLFGCGTIVLFFFVRTTRTFIALHTDVQISQHMKKSVVACMAVAGPSLYLFAETAGCVLTEENFMQQCARLQDCNWAVTFQLLTSAVFYTGTGITHANITSSDLMSLQKVDAGSYFRGLLQVASWLMALVLFGARPRNIQSGEEGEIIEDRLVGVAIAMRYVLIVLWFLILSWEYLHIRHMVHVDRVLAGTSEKYDGIARGVAARWKNGWEVLDDWVKRQAVGADQARVATVYKWGLFLSSWTALVPIFVSLVLYFVKGGDDNLAVLGYMLWVSLKVPCFASSVGFQFLDLSDPENEYRRWKYIDFHAYIIIFGTVLEMVVGALLFDYFSFISGVLLICTITVVRMAAHQRKKMMADASVAERSEHIYLTVVPTTLSLIVPVSFMTSELSTCWTRSYLQSDATGGLLLDNTDCDGISVGISPLMLLIAATGMIKVIFLTSRGTKVFAMEDISVLNVSATEVAQIFVLGICSSYALVAYGLRRERVIDEYGSDGWGFNIFCVLLVLVIGLNSCKKNDAGIEEDLRKTTTPRQSSSATAATKRGSVSDRRTVGVTKSIWEGGSRGTGSRGSMKSYSTRGILNELNSEEKGTAGEIFEGIEREGESVFNPGFV